MAVAATGVTGLILAGGEGRRMGGADKGLLTFAERPLVCHAADRLRPQVDTLLLSANRNAEVYRALGFEPLADPLRDDGRSAGPLAGVLAGLASCRSEWLVTVACDVPALPEDLVARLRSAAQAAGAPAALAITRSGPHPVFMLVRRGLLPDLRHFVSEGGRRVRDWQDRVGAVTADFPKESAFANINTPQDLLRQA